MKGILPESDMSYKKPKKNGKPGEYTRVWKYSVIGTPEEIAAYELAQGSLLRHNDKDGNKPIFFSTVCYGSEIELAFKQDGGVYVNTEKADMIKDQIEMYGDKVANALAAQIAASMNLTGISSRSNTPTESFVDDSADDLGNLGG